MPVAKQGTLEQPTDLTLQPEPVDMVAPAAPPKPTRSPHFGSVRKAREALKERAHELLDKHFKLIDMAIAAGDFETANKAIQFLEEHMPEEAGLRLVDMSIDKPKQVESGPKGPTINIGFAMGGVAKKSLEEPAIRVIPAKDVHNEAM